MQTFLPYQDFSKSAAALDDKRLNNQINEALIILRTLTGWYAKNGGKGWPNHPCTKQWSGYEAALCSYTLEMFGEYNARAYRPGIDFESRFHKIIDALRLNVKQYQIWHGSTWILPPWLTEDFCAEHRKLLLEKDFAFYSGKFDALELEGYNVPV